MKNRVLWKMFALEIVTLGIYRLYYLIKTRKEMMQHNPAVKILSPWFLLAPFIVMLIGAALFIAAITMSTQNTTPTICIGPNFSSENQSSPACTSTSSSPNAILTIAATLGVYGGVFLGMILFVVWIWSYSQAVAIITEGKLSFALCLVILVLVPDGIDILIIQDYFNKIGTTSMGPHMPQPSVPVGPVASV